MSQIEARWLHKDSNTLASDGLNLKVKTVNKLHDTVDGIDIVPNSVILPEGTVAYTADQSMGLHRLKDLAQPQTETDSANKIYVDGLFNTASTRCIQTETIQLTNQNIIDGYVDLLYPAVASNEVYVNVTSGGLQRLNYDFVVQNNGTRISWKGIGLEAHLAADDSLVVMYSRAVGIITGQSQYSTKVHNTLNAASFAADSNKIGVVPSSFLNIYDAMKFSSAVDGALWFTLPITPAFVYHTDVIFDLVFGVTLRDGTVGHKVRLHMDLYEASAGADVSPTPTVSQYDDILPGGNGVANMLMTATTTMAIPGNKINESGIAYGIRVWRDTSIPDNYNSEFVLLSITPRQIV